MTSSAPPVVYFFDYALDPANARLWRGDEALALRPKTLSLLAHLAANPQRLITKAELLDTVWSETAVTDWVLTTSIRELRDALGDDARQPRIIETVHRRGYRFIAPIGSAPSASTAEPTGSISEPLALESRSSGAGAVLLGREADLDRMGERLRAAAAGDRQVVFVIGEAGMGKSALVEQFSRRLRTGETSRRYLVAHGQCIEQLGAGEPYLPVLEALERVCREPGGAAFVDVLRRHAPSWLVQMSGLLDAGECEALERRLGAASRERMLREIAAVVAALPAPLVLLLEDLHWSDHATLDVVATLAQRRDPARLLLVGTYRPVEVSVRNHPLRKLHQDLSDHGRCHDLWLAPLTESDIAHYLDTRWPGFARPDALASVLHEHTDGNPLFLINIADYLAVNGTIREVDGEWSLQSDTGALAAAIPPGLRQLIAAHIERLDDPDRTALEAGSLVGRKFSAALVAAALGVETTDVEERLDHLARNGLMVAQDGASEWPDGSVAGAYRFDHFLYQSVLRDRVPPARRRQQHERIATRLEQAYEGCVAEVSAELAVHMEAAGQAERAVPHLEEAAARAIRRGAHREAVVLLEQALATLDPLPRTPERTLRTIRLCMTLAPALAPASGYGDPGVEHFFDRARRLSEELDDPIQLFQALIGVMTTYVSQARFDRARETAQQLEQLLIAVPLPSFVFAGSLLNGMATYHGGALTDARRLLERALSLGDVPLPPLATDMQMLALDYLALTLVHQGYPDQARERLRQAENRARALGRPSDLSFTAQVACHVSILLRDVSGTETAAELAATDPDFPVLAAIGRVGRGAVLSARGDHERAVAAIREGIEAYRANAQRVAMPMLLGTLADSHAAAGDRGAAFACIAEARAAAESSHEIRYLAELDRLEGELHRMVGDRDAAERCFRRAVELARAQGARWWELRSTTSLARLMLQRGTAAKTREACRDDLARLLGSYGEGPDLPDLVEASRVLRSLSQSA